MKSSLILTLLLTPLAGWSFPLVDQEVSRQLEFAVEQELEDTVSDTVEQSVEESVEESVAGIAEQQVEEAVEQAVGDAVGNAVAQGVEQEAEQGVEQAVAGTVEETISASVSDAVGQTVEAGVSEAMSGGIQQNIADTVTQTASRATESAVVSDLGTSVEATVEGLADDSLGVELPPGAAATEALSGADKTAVVAASGETLFYEVTLEDGSRAVEREWLVAAQPGDLAGLEQPGVTVLEKEPLPALGMLLLRIRVDGNQDGDKLLRAFLPDAVGIERNHIYDYRPQAGEEAAAEPISHREAVCDDPVRIGVVDTAVEVNHPLLAAADISQRTFSTATAGADRDHGSAVVGLLVARGSGTKGLTPNAALSVAAVMYDRRDGSQGATALSLVKALNWLVARDVQVVNLSLAGPPNDIMERAIDSVTARGIALVAAVGNDGPVAPALYPAAYPQVIGVTAVDRERRVYRWANRGQQVDFAAPGVSVKTLDGNAGVTVTSGTSMAAPVVSAFAACFKEKGISGNLRPGLARRAIDLGDPGRDATFGLGLLESGAP